jgi:hypothetical protein
MYEFSLAVEPYVVADTDVILCTDDLADESLSVNRWKHVTSDQTLVPSVYATYEGRPESKVRLRIAQVNTPRRYNVVRPQSSVGFVPSKFSTDCII